MTPTVNRSFAPAGWMPPVQAQAAAPAEAAIGTEAEVRVRVNVDPGSAQYHVVRMNVYAPGSEDPHRQYSQNIGCPDGAGRTTIPFALSDPTGEWRLVLRDVASGAETTRTVALVQQ